MWDLSVRAFCWQPHKKAADRPAIIGQSLELPYGVGIVGKVGNELGRTQ